MMIKMSPPDIVVMTPTAGAPGDDKVETNQLSAFINLFLHFSEMWNYRQPKLCDEL